MNAGFPVVRPRRLRRTPALRALVRENHLRPGMLIMPLFVHEAPVACEPIASMPGQFRYSVEQVPAEAVECARLGLGAVLLFGIPARKDGQGSGAWDEEGVVQRAIRAIKRETDLPVIADVCLCEYTDHGHCGLLSGDGAVNNDASLDLLSRTAVSLARAGADMVAPSDMMDGRVAAIRAALDGAGFAETPILSYAAKHASALYGPFRLAADSAPRSGDRRAYQMDPANGREALREMEQDCLEGADLLMIKPALSCLDLVRQAADRFSLPLVVYQVSGEYLMLKAAAASGYLDEQRAVLETLTACRRAGASLIVTYYARAVADWLRVG